MEPRQASGPAQDGERLAALEPRLRLLLAHLAGRSIRRRFELDDLLQEVYLRALAAPLPEAACDAGTLWRHLVPIARHAVIDVARALRAQKRAGEPLSLDRSRSGGSAAGALRASGIPGRGAGPATNAATLESARLLARRFEALSAEHRRVIGLRQFEGLSAREAAARMGRSESALHSLYRRALLAWGAGGADSARDATNPLQDRAPEGA